MENAHDYLVWKYAILTILNKEGLTALVDGKAIQPTLTENSGAEEFRLLHRWNDCNGVVQAFLVNSVGKAQVALLTQCKTAKEVWDRLESLYHQKSSIVRARLEDELQTLKWRRNTPLETFIQEIDKLSEKLEACGLQISDDRKTMILLRGLPERYETSRLILFQAGEKPYLQTCEDLRAHVGLTSPEENKAYLGVNEGPSGQTPQNPPKMPYRQKQQNLSKTPNQCSFCKRLHHTVDKCFAKKKFDNVCGICRQRGHYPSECKGGPQRGRPGGHQPEPPTAWVVTAGQEDSTLLSTSNSQEWIVDSGATKHMCTRPELIQNTRPGEVLNSVFLGNSSKLEVISKGEVPLTLALPGSNTHSVILHEVLGVPGLSKNLLSVSQCIKSGCSVLFQGGPNTAKFIKGEVRIMGEVIGEAEERGGLWVLKTSQIEEQTMQQVNMVHTQPSKAMKEAERWHRRFGHLGIDGLKKLSSQQMVEGLSPIPPEVTHFECEACKGGKQSRKPFPAPLTPSKSLGALDLIHSDLIGPITPSSMGGCKYILTFLDDFSNYAWVYPMASKDGTFSAFLNWKASAERQLGRKVKTFRSDNGGEFVNNSFKTLFSTEGIRHETSIPYTPQQNGKAERWNRTLMEMVRSMLLGAGSEVPKSLWGEAVMAATYTRNRCHSRSIPEPKTPCEMLFGLKPDVSHLKPWGCIVLEK